MPRLADGPELTERLRAWTYRRQRLGRAGEGPGEALRDVVGVYSSHPTTPLALLARSRTFAPDDLGDLERRKEAVRFPAMRQTVFLLPTAFAGRILAITRLPIERHLRRLHRTGLTLDGYDRLRARVRETLREPLLPAAIPAALGGIGELPDEAALVTAVRIMAYEGAVLRIGSHLRTNTLRYVATEAWLGGPLDDHDPADALRWLADRYLRAYGPARVADFVWWAGVTRTRASASLAALDTVDLGGGLLLPADQADPFASVAPLDPDAMLALPKWDAYTMGHAPDGRQRLVADAHLKLAYSQGGGGTLPGDGFPLLLRGGRAVATWGHRFAGNRMLVTVTPFPGEDVPPSLYEGAFAAAGELLGASAVQLG